MNNKFVIWKYTLDLTDYQVIKLPTGAVPLTAQLQRGTHLRVWAQVPDGYESETDVAFHIFGTGHIASCSGQYLSTFQMSGGALVFHVYWGEPE